MQNSRKKSRDKSLPTRTVESNRLTKGQKQRVRIFIDKEYSSFCFQVKGTVLARS